MEVYREEEGGAAEVGRRVIITGEWSSKDPGAGRVTRTSNRGGGGEEGQELGLRAQGNLTVSVNLCRLQIAPYWRIHVVLCGSSAAQIPSPPST